MAAHSLLEPGKMPSRGQALEEVRERSDWGAVVLLEESDEGGIRDDQPRNRGRDRAEKQRNRSA